MAEFFDMLINEYRDTVGVSCYVILFIVTILYMLLKKGEEAWKKTLMVTTPIIILLLIILNPLYNLVLSKIADYAYYRLFWTMPADILIGYMVVNTIRQNRGFKKWVFMICSIFLLIIMGNPIHKTFGIAHYDNLYKVSSQQIEITNAIINDKNGKNKRALVSMKGTQLIRSYDSQIQLQECGIGMMKPQEVVKYMESKKCDYAIINKKEDAYMGEYEGVGLLKLVDSDDYTVYVKKNLEE